MSHVVHAVDCLSPEGLPSLADGSVAHTICDPPYEAEAHTLQRRIKRGKAHGEGYGGGDTRSAVMAPLSFDPISDWERAIVAGHIARVTRRWALVFCQAEGAHKWISALTSAGMTYRRSAIWVKPDGQPQLSGDRPGVGYETIVCCHAHGRSVWNGGGRLGVYEYSKYESDRTHEAQKPMRLMEALIRDFTEPGEVVLDPYAGSGTTGAACKRLGRNFVGYERDQPCALGAQQRIYETQEQLDCFVPKVQGVAAEQSSLFLPPTQEEHP